MAKVDIIKTSDGSETLYSAKYDATYHSMHGALQEAKHVYISEGLSISRKDHIRVFEMGFGTGLNTILSALYAEDHHLSIHYTSIEQFPIPMETALAYNTNGFLPPDKRSVFEKMHALPWEEWSPLSACFNLLKVHGDLLSTPLDGEYDVIYYDAFAPTAQPELWTPEVFRLLYELLAPGGILTTYCCKGQVKRDLKEVGFNIERLKGPPGKRHMLRAIKN